MRIAVDGYEVGSPMGGVGRITAALVTELARRWPESGFRMFVRRPTGLFPSPNVEEAPLTPDRGYIRWQNGPLRKALKRYRPDILLATNYTLPIRLRAPAVLFEHDISFVSHREWYSRRDVLKGRWLVPRSLRWAAAVVTESEFSRQEILNRFPFVPDSKIHVIHPGIDTRFRRASPSEIAAWKESRGLGGRRVVGFLGSIFNRRRIPELIEAVRLLRERSQDVCLYLVGRDRTRPPQAIADRVKPDWIRWDQGMGDEELPLFYSSCDAFAYLSEYEGFGLPPLEALSCGTVPVVLNRTSLAEVYRDTAVKVENPEPQDVRAALDRILTDSGVRRAALTSFEAVRGRYSWKTAGDELGGLIRRIVGGSRL